MRKSRRVLVTGGAGFIGGNLLPVLLSEGMDPVLIDDLSSGVSCVPEGTKVHHLSCHELADNPELLEGADAVVHLAGKPSVEFANQRPLEALEANVTDTLRLILAAANAGVRRFVFASSNASVGMASGPVHEEVLPRPISFYGASKLSAEAYCLASASFLGLEPVILRFANVYGPLSAHKPSAVHKFVKMALSGQSIAIYGDGSQTRDFIYVEDVCRAIVKAIRAPYSESTFQIGTGTSTSIVELIKLLEALLGNPVRKEFQDARPGDIRHSVSDIRRAQQHLGWEPQSSLREGLAKTIKYYLSVPAGSSLITA